MTNRATLWYAVAIALAVASACGCKGKAAASASGGGLPAATQATKAAAVEVRGAAATIDTANRRIEAAAPALSAETQTIATGVARLNSVAGTLEATGTGIAAGAEQLAKAEADLADARKRIADLEEAKDGLLSRLLTFGAVAGLGLAVVGGVWLRSVNAVVTGLGIFAACVAGQWIIAYRAAIAITGLVLVGLVLGWKLLKEHLAAQQLVTTIEAGKGTIADWQAFASVANSVQNKYTRRVVDQVQKSLGIKKAAKP
jgi:hypothetical protein